MTCYDSRASQTPQPSASRMRHVENWRPLQLRSRADKDAGAAERIAGSRSVMGKWRNGRRSRLKSGRAKPVWVQIPPSPPSIRSAA